MWVKAEIGRFGYKNALVNWLIQNVGRKRKMKAG
jgi:hypothetical protein